MKLVLGTRTLASYPRGGGHWSVFIQYLLGLRALGHDVFLLDLLPRSGRIELDHRRIAIFLERTRRWGFKGSCAVLLYDGALPETFADQDVHGTSASTLKEVARDADVLWNFHGSLTRPLLNNFSTKALIDLDPGLLQVPALKPLIDDHDFFFSVGLKMIDTDCGVPRFGRRWEPFCPPVHLPVWHGDTNPPANAPLTSVTQWTWGGHRLSDSKRDAYLRFLDLPRRCAVPFLLAANIHPQDNLGDRELLTKHGWRLVEPHHCVPTVERYEQFIRNSVAEFGCAKPVYTALRSGWFSDRSAAYLASARPVIAEDTGFSHHLPTGLGLLCFTTMEEAVARVDDLLSSYARHQKAARDIAETYFNAEHVLSKMIARLN